MNIVIPLTISLLCVLILGCSTTKEKVAFEILEVSNIELSMEPVFKDARESVVKIIKEQYKDVCGIEISKDDIRSIDKCYFEEVNWNSVRRDFAKSLTDFHDLKELEKMVAYTRSCGCIPFKANSGIDVTNVVRGYAEGAISPYIEKCGNYAKEVFRRAIAKPECGMP